MRQSERTLHRTHREGMPVTLGDSEPSRRLVHEAINMKLYLVDDMSLIALLSSSSGGLFSFLSNILGYSGVSTVCPNAQGQILALI